MSSSHLHWKLIITLIKNGCLLSFFSRTLGIEDNTIKESRSLTSLIETTSYLGLLSSNRRELITLIIKYIPFKFLFQFPLS
jgi:hypothetical protein